jgi:hypothetical protein
MSADKLFSWLPPPHNWIELAPTNSAVLVIRNGSPVMARIYLHDVRLSIILFVCDRFLLQRVHGCDTNRPDPTPGMKTRLHISTRVYA